jgi:hypothetical protein
MRRFDNDVQIRLTEKSDLKISSSVMTEPN